MPRPLGGVVYARGRLTAPVSLAYSAWHDSSPTWAITMRRSEREITNRTEIDAIIRSCQVCRVGLADGIEPYIVPMSFGYDGVGGIAT